MKLNKINQKQLRIYGTLLAFAFLFISLMFVSGLTITNFKDEGNSTNITFYNNSNQTLFLEINRWANVSEAFLNITGLRQYPETNTFNNSLTIENLTIFNNQNLTRYLNISRYSNFESAYMNLSGYSSRNLYPNEIYNLSDDGLLAIRGITQNETYIWVLASGNIYKYYKNLTYTGENWGVGISNTYGITQNETYMWVVGFAFPDNVLRKYYINGTYTGDSITLENPSSPRGVTQNGTYLWIADLYGGVYKYYMNGTYTGETWNAITRAWGITTYENYIYIGDLDTKNIHKYYMNGTYTGINFSLQNASFQLLGLSLYDNIFLAGGGQIINEYPTITSINNITISINNINIWNYSGTFNQTNNKTNDFSSILNNALNNGTCSGGTLEGDNCIIPFVFHSDTTGILGYSDVGLTTTYPSNMVLYERVTCLTI